MARLPPARFMVLDLDGTLVDTVPDLAAALNRLMTSRGLSPFDHAQTASMVGDGVARLVQKAFAARGALPDATAITDFSGDYGRHAAVESKLYPGVRPTLERMVKDGWLLSVCTNKPEAAARSLLSAVGLLDMMAAVGGGDSFPVRKPDPAHLLATLAACGGDPARAVMAGDHANDVVASHGAGLPCIYAAWGYGTPDMASGSAAVAHTIEEMAAAAERLVGA